MAKKNDPLAAFVGKKIEAEAILAGLLGFVSEHCGVDPDDVSWGHVGDMGYLIEQLKEINGHFGRGEKYGGEKMDIGDRIKVKIATRSGWIKGWRTVNGVNEFGHKITIRAHGLSHFGVRPEEILEVRTRGDAT